MAVEYQQKCMKCKKNYVTVSGRKNRFVVCYECQKKELEGKISDPKMKKLFDIPEEFYRKNAFLRDIKISYLRYGQLSERQIEAFKKTVKDLKDKL
ncbi:hypothetical protein DRJ25_04215 [Candidatus Woesearchaeota archaeon]|nr:MAG: hypothetical protein DRJ25_04215 [Candidatus Woesearchaeota archaeon]